MEPWCPWPGYATCGVVSVMRVQRFWVILLLLVGVSGVVAWWWFNKQPQEALPELLPCADLVKGCGNAEVSVQSDRMPKVMQVFELRFKAQDAQSVRARFDMREMQMGLNQYRFLRQQNGDWLAKVTLPVCVSGSSDWLMNIEMDTDAGKRRYQLPFTAD